MLSQKTILYIAGAKPTYPRNANALRMLRKSFTVREITSSTSAYWQRFFLIGVKFLLTRKRDVDVIYIGFMGQPIVFLVRLFTRKPIVFDVFISLYDSICLERQSFKPSSLIGIFLHWLDKKSCQLSSFVICDTKTYASWFVRTFQLDPKCIGHFYICADASIFHPLPKKRDDDRFVVEFHGGYIPLQGVKYIIRAAEILMPHHDIYFTFLGAGRDLSKAKKLVEDLKLKNITFFDRFVPLSEVPQFISDADVALGIFGTTGKTLRVIPNKAYEGMACRRAVINANSAAAREIFTDGENVLLVPEGDPEKLAEAILKLKHDDNLRGSIAESGYKLFQDVCDDSKRTQQLKSFVEKACS